MKGESKGQRKRTQWVFYNTIIISFKSGSVFPGRQSEKRDQLHNSDYQIGRNITVSQGDYNYYLKIKTLNPIPPRAVRLAVLKTKA